MKAGKACGALVAAGVAALAVIPVASGSSGTVTQAKKRTVKVGDYFLSPSSLKVARRTTIVFKWPTYEGGAEHDVALRQRPKGVKKWRSKVRSSNYTYKRKLYKRGKYVVICTLHPGIMRTVIRVK